jgi:dGTPase
LKYPWTKQEAGYESRKWGAYTTEQREFGEARAAAPYLNSKTLEAELMDWADDVAYAVYDLDDFYRAGLIPLDRLVEQSTRHIDRLFDNIRTRWDQQRRDFGGLATYKEQFVKLLQLMATRPSLTDAYSGSRAQRAALRDVTSFLVNRYAGAVELAPSTQSLASQDALVKGSSAIMIPPEMRTEVTVLKELAWAYVIENPALAAQQEGQREIVRLLFTKFLKAAEETRWNIFPGSMRSDLKESRTQWSQDPVLRMRVVSDLISSMTEIQAIEMYRRLTGHSSRSVMQRIIR